MLSIHKSTISILIALRSIMEYIEYDLKHLIEERGAIGIPIAKRYSLQLFNAVKYIHDLGIIHSDIKPQNIMVKGEDIKLIDFGISIVYIESSNTGFISTAEYRALELFFPGSFTKSVDIWSCGVIIAEMVRGDVLFKAEGEYEDSDHQLSLIEELIGTYVIQQYEDDYGRQEDHDFKYYLYEDKDIEEFFKTDDKLLTTLLMGTIAPSEDRWTVERCINSRWFASR